MMWRYQGFKTKDEAKEFAKDKKSARIVWEKNEFEKKGRLPEDYQVCLWDGMPRELLYAVIYRVD